MTFYAVDRKGRRDAGHADMLDAVDVAKVHGEGAYVEDERGVAYVAISNLTLRNRLQKRNQELARHSTGGNR